jgi:5-methylcytosine-specific restriction endonuclease McrA
VIFNPSSRPRTIGHIRALVLNSSYQPVKLVSWQRALLLWFQGKVEVLEYHPSDEVTVRSAREEFQVPSVLRLKRFINHRRFTRVKFCRENVYRRDDYRCQYCGDEFNVKELTLDHVVPASKKGRKDWTNMVTACRRCNHRKAQSHAAGCWNAITFRTARSGMATANPNRPLNWTIFPESWRAYLGGLSEDMFSDLPTDLEDLTG